MGVLAGGGISLAGPARGDTDATAPSGRRRLLADGALLMVSVVWGATFPAVKAAVADAPPLTFLALRFALAFLVLAAVFGGALRRHWRLLSGPGLVAGLWLAGGFAFQTQGLRYTLASRAGFITGLSVVMVPFFSARLLGVRPPPRALAGVALALAGLLLLFLVPGAGVLPGPGRLTEAPTIASGGLPGSADLRLLGDLLVFGCAACFAVHITVLGRYSPALASSMERAGALAALQVGTAALAFAVLWGLGRLGGGSSLVLPAPMGSLSPLALAVIVTTALLATAGAFLVQTAAQRHTSPTHTALIFATEPVFAAAFGWLFMGERLGTWGTLGCALILAGMLAAEWPAREA